MQALVLNVKFTVLLLGIPMVVMALVLIYAMRRIKKAIDGLDAAEFYQKEKLVFLHVFLFTLYTVLWFIF